MSTTEKISNKERLVEHAGLLILEKGYPAFTIDSVIERTGIAKSNAYYHFASKEQLGIAVLEHLCQLHQQFIKQTLHNPTLDPKSRISIYFSRLIQFQEKTGWGDGIGTLVTNIDSEEARALYNQSNQSWRMALETTIQDGQLHYFNRAISAHRAALLISRLVTGALQEARVTHSTEALQDAYKDTLSLLK